MVQKAIDSAKRAMANRRPLVNHYFEHERKITNDIDRGAEGSLTRGDTQTKLILYLFEYNGYLMYIFISTKTYT